MTLVEVEDLLNVFILSMHFLRDEKREVKQSRGRPVREVPWEPAQCISFEPTH